VSGCGEEYFHVDMVAPAVVTTMQYEDGTIIENDDVVVTGSVVMDTAVLVGATDDASGTATYQLYSDAACTLPVGEPQVVTVANGEIPNSAVFTVNEPGAYYWVVTYSGDANNLEAVSGCGEELFRAEDPVETPTAEPVDPTVTPTVEHGDPTATPNPGTPEPGDPTPMQPVVEGLPETGSGQGSPWIAGSLIAFVAVAFVASALRVNRSTR